MANHNNLGKEGEQAAVAYLKKNGYQILHTNWHHGHLELDIVAQKDDELIFAEVKTRSPQTIVDPEEAVTNLKIRHLLNAADSYIKWFNIDLSFRFDIICVIGNFPDFEIDHLEDAFYPPVNIRRF